MSYYKTFPDALSQIYPSINIDANQFQRRMFSFFYSFIVLIIYVFFYIILFLIISYLERVSEKEVF